MNVPLQQFIDQQLLRPRAPEFSKPVPDSSFCPSTSLSLHSQWMGFSVSLVSLDLILVSQTVSRTPPPSPFSPHQLRFLSCPSSTPQPDIQCHSLTKTILSCPFPWPWQSRTLEQPHYLEFLLMPLVYVLLLEKKHSTVSMLMSFSLCLQSHCPLNIAQGVFYKSLVEDLVGLIFPFSYGNSSGSKNLYLSS